MCAQGSLSPQATNISSRVAKNRPQLDSISSGLITLRVTTNHYRVKSLLPGVACLVLCSLDSTRPRCGNRATMNCSTRTVMAGTMIQLEGVSKVYRTGEVEVRALDGY